MSNDVLVVAEHLQRQILESTFEALGLARDVAAAAGGRTIAVLPGWEAESLTESLGAADEVVYLEHEALENFSSDAWKSALIPLLQERDPLVTLISMSATGMDLAAPLSAALNVPLVASAKSVSIEDGKKIVSSQLYAGKASVESEFSGTGIVAVMTGALDPDQGRSDRKPPVTKVQPVLEASAIRVSFSGLVEPSGEDVDITREEVLVSVGRGVEREDNVSVVEELAEALGGVLSASRPVVDQEWLPRTRQVGKSGATVKPRLYLALGISGAPEHLEGMKDAELIVAVNTDPSAPIFEAAHYGATEDMLDVVESLTEKVREAKEG